MACRSASGISALEDDRSPYAEQPWLESLVSAALVMALSFYPQRRDRVVVRNCNLCPCEHSRTIFRYNSIFGSHSPRKIRLQHDSEIRVPRGPLVVEALGHASNSANNHSINPVFLRAGLPRSFVPMFGPNSTRNMTIYRG